MKIFQSIVFSILISSQIRCIIQEESKGNEQFNIFKTKSIFQGKQNKNQKFKLDGYAIPTQDQNRKLKIQNKQSISKQDVQQPKQKLSLFSKKTFLHTDHPKKEARKTEDIHGQIQQAIEDSNHQYPVIVLNKVSQDQINAEKDLKKKQEQQSQEDEINQSQQQTLENQDSNGNKVSDQKTNDLNTSVDVNDSDQQKNEIDKTENQNNKEQSLLDTYHYDKDYLYQDPYYVKHPLYYNPYDKFGFEKSKKEPEEKVSIDEIDTLVEVLNFISSIYFQLFSVLPEQKTAKEKGNLERTMDVLRFYVKVKTFIQTVFQQRDQLIEDMNFLEGKIHLIKFKQENVVNFYNLESQYFKVQLKQMTYRNDLRMQSYVKDFEEIVKKFETDAKTVLKFAYDLGKFTELFLDEVEELQKTETNVPAFQVLITFDKVMMLVIKLLENKMSIERSIHNLRNSMQNLKQYKTGIEETFYNMQNFDNKLEIELEKKEKIGKNIQRFSFMMIITFILLTLIQLYLIIYYFYFLLFFLEILFYNEYRQCKQSRKRHVTYYIIFKKIK